MRLPVRLRLPVDDVILTREKATEICVDDQRYQNGRNLVSSKKEKIKAQTANVLRHPNLSASDRRRKIDETYEADAPSEKRRSSKKLVEEDTETKRLRKRL